MNPEQLLKLANSFFKLARLDKESLKDLEKYVTNSENPEYFISFSDHIKLGLNPKSNWKNPKGIYGKAFTRFEYINLLNIRGGYDFNTKPYFTIFKVNNVLNIKNYTEDQYFSDLQKIKSIYSEIEFTDSFLELIINEFVSRRQASIKLPIVKILAITDYLSDHKDSNWSNLLRSLGFTNLYSADSNEGFIYPQIAVLDPSIIEIVETRINPSVMNLRDVGEKSETNMLVQKIRNRNRELINLLADKDLPSNMLRNIYNSNLNQEQLLLMLTCKNVPPDILEKLANHSSPEIKGQVASHPNTNLKTLQLLSEDPNLQWRIASHPNCSSKLLTSIFESGDEFVRSEIINNSKVTPDLLKKYLTESKIPEMDAWDFSSYKNNKDILYEVINGDYSPVSKQRARTILKKIN